MKNLITGALVLAGVTIVSEASCGEWLTTQNRDAPPSTLAPSGTDYPLGQWLPEPIIPPEQIPPRPHMSREEFKSYMMSPLIRPELKQYALELFNKPFQPIEVPVPGGTVIVNPWDYRQQQFRGDIQKRVRRDKDGAERGISTQMQYDPKSGRLYERIIPQGW
jgi:hypothetical protein